MTVVLAMGCGSPDPGKTPSDLSIDQQIAAGIARYDIEPLEAPAERDPAKVALGRVLFFDKILSGNRDTSCASCHHPRHRTADDSPFSAGTGAIVDGLDRQLGPRRTWTARNSTDLYNRGGAGWTTQFWDMRVRTNDAGDLLTPAGSRLPDGLDNVVAAQAMFPVTGRDEMRGQRWDEGVDGQPNELGRIVDGLLVDIWAGLMERLLAIDQYRRLFRRAYPGVPLDQMGFEDAANAIAAFEIEAFAMTDSPWDRYVAGQRDALDDAQKQGAALFFGSAGCADCHTGTLLTDQQAHNLAVPQFGPGKSPDEPLDLGYGRVSNDPRDNFAFRTPTLRNVVLTGPYMHNGAFETLRGAIRHHTRPVESLRTYDGSQLPAKLRQTLRDEAPIQKRIVATLDDDMQNPPELSASQIDSLIAFLHALTGHGAAELTDVPPDSVPSGLPVEQ